MIKLQCVCGHLLSLPDELDGKQVRCKRCNKVLKVHRTARPSDEARVSESGKLRVEAAFMVQGTRPCPGCGKSYAPAIVVCTDCGLNIDSGAMLYASLETPDASVQRAQAEAAKASASLWQRVLRGLGFGRKS